MPRASLAASTLTFAVLGELGHGGMARVDLARLAKGDGRLVAVKRPHVYLAKDREFVQMFLDEAWVTGMIQHPNVVGLVGWGWDEDGMFLATEFIAGVSLATLTKDSFARGEPLPQELVAYIGTQVASALAAAHALRDDRGRLRGVVHRDISPGNILLGFDGSVKITDFGIAKALATRAQTATGILKGKIAYIAPEYVHGKSFDGRADIFSLGVVLYELLCLKRPFGGKNDMDTLRLLLTADPELLSPQGRVELRLATMIDRMLARDPEARPRTGEEVARDLDAWLVAHSFELSVLKRRLGEKVESCGGDRRQHLQRLTHPDSRVDAGDVGPHDATVITVHTRRTPLEATHEAEEPHAPGTRKVLVPAAPTGQASGTWITRGRRSRWAFALIGAIIPPLVVLAFVRRPATVRPLADTPVTEISVPPVLVVDTPAAVDSAETPPASDSSAPATDDVASARNRRQSDRHVMVHKTKASPSSSPPASAEPKRGSCNPHDFDYVGGRCVP